MADVVNWYDKIHKVLTFHLYLCKKKQAKIKFLINNPSLFFFIKKFRFVKINLKKDFISKTKHLFYVCRAKKNSIRIHHRKS